ncbi:uncharacterized protein AB675_1821 [Cyphellophora attinorum]|uniref:Uncharacterized protein n=1 Tax=Cyphellophora attinorum TaxID=1664694 RepID=A0A0N1H8A3_9EURO|nr:uncharacterized protein AB675_1821 [Phialophora attinorum]KPI43106.1 hypothetical protein AB675_1821 [Phialophora attinorum]
MSTSSPDIIDVLVSEGYNIYTQVSSALYPQISSVVDGITNTRTRSTTDATATGESSSRSSSSSTFATSTSSSASSSASSSSSRATSAAASASSAAAAAANQGNGGGGGDNKLPIILGSVLGALALGLFILALLFCCRRRRRRSRAASARHSALSPNDDEIDGWRGHPQHARRFSSEKTLLGAGAMGAAGGAMAGRHRDSKDHARVHENPFTPVPPPPRRSTPNSRPGLTDGMVPGDDAYITEKGSHKPWMGGSRSRSSSGHGKDLALGLGGAAVGAAALHHHNRNKSEAHETDALMTQPEREHTISRKPVRTSGVSSPEPWSPEPPPPVHEPGTFVAAGSDRQSFDSARSRLSRDATRANAAFDNGYGSPEHGISKPTDEHGQGGMDKAAAAAGVGALGGAALARRHHDKHEYDISSGSNTAVASPAMAHAHPERNSRIQNTLDGAHDDAHHNSLGTTAAAAGLGGVGGAALAPPSRNIGRDSKHEPFGHTAIYGPDTSFASTQGLPQSAVQRHDVDDLRTPDHPVMNDHQAQHAINTGAGAGAGGPAFADHHDGSNRFSGSTYPGHPVDRAPHDDHVPQQGLDYPNSADQVSARHSSSHPGVASAVAAAGPEVSPAPPSHTTTTTSVSLADHGSAIPKLVHSSTPEPMTRTPPRHPPQANTPTPSPTHPPPNPNHRSNSMPPDERVSFC